MKIKASRTPSGFEKLSSRVAKASGTTTAFIGALSVIVIWIISGPFFKFSDTWQLVINTGTTIITFLMVFLIQRSQNKDSVAIHLKLNELVTAQEHASNRLVAVENISENELQTLQEFYSHLSVLAKKEITVEESHSINEANEQHQRKTTENKRTKKNNPDK